MAAHGTTTRYARGCRCESCRAANTAYAGAYHAAHPEKCAEASRRWHEAHPGKHAEYSRRWRAAHREQVAEANRRWREAHSAQVAEYNRNRRARKRNAPGTHTAADVCAQYERQRGKCWWCGEKTGDDYHVDHVIPLILGGSNGPENLVIACAHCNLSKNAKHPMEFAGRLC